MKLSPTPTILVFLLFTTTTLLFSHVSAYRGWTPVNISEIPRALPDDVIDVIQLEAPLFSADYGDLLAYFHLFHAGLGFHNRRTGVNWTVEYDALPDFVSCVTPRIEKEDNQTDLIWQNNGGAILYLSINETYWTSLQKVVTVINGTIHNNFLEWLKPVNSTHKHYNLFSVYDHWNDDETKRNLLLDSFTCADFLFEEYKILYELGAKFLYQKMPRNYINFYAKHAPTKVSYDDPKHKNRMIEFYELVEGRFRELGFVEFLLSFIDVMAGDVYYRHGDDYYLVELHFPSVNWRYRETWMPGYGPQHKERVRHLDMRINN